LLQGTSPASPAVAFLNRRHLPDEVPAPPFRPPVTTQMSGVIVYSRPALVNIRHPETDRYSRPVWRQGL